MILGVTPYTFIAFFPSQVIFNPFKTQRIVTLLFQNKQSSSSLKIKKSLVTFSTFKALIMAPERKVTRIIKNIFHLLKRKNNLLISLLSPPTTVDVPKQWFENHTVYEKWVDVFKNRTMS